MNRSTARFSKIVLTPDVVYAVGFARKSSPFRFHFASISPETGKMIEWFQPDSDILSPNKDFVIFQRPDLSGPVVLWFDGGAFAVRYLTLRPDLRDVAKQVDGIYSGLVDIGQGSLGQAVLTRKDGSSYLLRWRSEGAAETLHDFGVRISSFSFVSRLIGKRRSPQRASSRRTTAGSMARSVITSLKSSMTLQLRCELCLVPPSHSKPLQHAHATVFAEQLKSAKELPKFSFPFDKRTDGGIRHVCFGLFRLYWLLIMFQIAASVESEADGSIKPHFFVSAETGSVQLWSEGGVKWKREEALASIAAAEFVEFPEQQAAETLHAETKEGFFGRLARHIVDAQVIHFFSIPKTILTVSIELPSIRCALP